MVRLARRGLLVVATLVLPSAARADLTFTQPLADAGQVRAGAPLAHTFHLANAGPAPVEITEVQGSCGCLTPKLAKRQLQPGEAADLVLEVHTLGQSAGVHHWRVRLTYRDGNRLVQTSLQLTADVLTELTVQPASLTMFTETAAAHDILVTDLRARPLTITELRPTSPHLKARLAGTYLDGRGHQVRKIQLEAGDDYPEGRHDEVLDIATDDPTYPNLRVPVTVVKRARQSVAVAPAQVQLTLAGDQALASKIVLVRDGAGREVAVDQVTSDNPAILVQWARGPGAMATVRVQAVRARAEAPQFQATVQVKVSKPEAKTLTVPVTCTVQ